MTNIILNMVISSLINFNSFVAISEPIHTNTFQNQNIFVQNSQILLLNSYSLIYTDIFEATKPNYCKKITAKSKISINNNSFNLMSNSSLNTQYRLDITIFEEYNPVADIFWKQNLWDLGYLLANFANTAIVYSLNSIDTTGILGYSYILTVSILEVFAIKSWENAGYQVSINIPIFNIQF